MHALWHQVNDLAESIGLDAAMQLMCALSLRCISAATITALCDGAALCTRHGIQGSIEHDNNIMKNMITGNVAQALRGVAAFCWHLCCRAVFSQLHLGIPGELLKDMQLLHGLEKANMYQAACGAG